MKQLQERLASAKQLVKTAESYILFYNGRVVDQKLNEGVLVKEGALFDGASIYSLPVSDAEKNAIANITQTNTIVINKNVDLTMIHIGDEEASLGYGLIVEENVEAFVHNIYFEISGLTNIKFDLMCKRGSNVTLKNVSNFSENIQSFVHAYCYNHAYIKIDDFALNKKEAQCFTDVVLLEELTEVRFNNVAINASGVKQSYKYNVFHVNKNTTSTITNYGISKNDSFLVFDNTGTITRGSSNSIMNQRTKGIILDLHSSISANPILAIDEADVVANHGASIGAIDENDLFYLMSRGLQLEESTALIVHGLIAPYFKDIKNESIQEYLFSETAKHL